MRTEGSVASVPDHYEVLGIKPEANREDIERAHKRLVKELRASRSADAPEELSEVDAAFSVLHDPAQRARYDAKRREAEAEEDEKFAKLDAELPRRRHRGRKHVSGSSAWIDALGWLFKLFR